MVYLQSYQYNIYTHRIFAGLSWTFDNLTNLQENVAVGKCEMMLLLVKKKYVLFDFLVGVLKSTNQIK